MARSPLLLVVASVCSFSLLPADTGHADTLETIAFSGDEAGPGSFAQFDYPRIDDLGEVAFYADLATGGPLYESIFFWPGEGAPELVASELSPIPGFDTGTLRHLVSDLLYLSNRGVAFVGFAGPSELEAIWGPNAAGELSLLLREGDPAPGLIATATLTGLYGDPPAFGNTGGVLTPDASATKPVYETEADTSLRVLAEKGQPAPAAEELSFCNRYYPLINDLGGEAFVALIDSDDCGTAAGQVGVLYGPDGPDELRIVAMQGDPAPGTSTTFASFAREGIGVNDAGGVAALARLATGDHALFGPAGAGLRLLARSGDLAPGTALPFPSTISFELALDGGGRVVLTSILSNAPFRQGLFASEPGGPLGAIHLTGDPAPGTDGTFLQFFDYEVNARGQVVFTAVVERPGPTYTSGLWLHDAGTTAARVLFLAGDVVEVRGSPRVLATSSPVTISRRRSGGEDGRGKSWNDAGELALVLRFSDASEGIFKLTVPEPALGSMAASAVASLAACQLLRRLRTGRSEGRRAG